MTEQRSRIWQKADGTMAVYDITDTQAANFGWTELIPRPDAEAMRDEAVRQVREANTVHMTLSLPKPDITDPEQLRFVAAFIQEWGGAEGGTDMTAEASMMHDEARGIEQARERDALTDHIADTLLSEMQLHDPARRGQFTIELDEMAKVLATALMENPTLSIERDD